jgi:acyl-CoA reductase-like NAD-dependent aldehyde dehydrogenase
MESENFAYLIAHEGGKPIRDARVEVSRAIQGIRYAAHKAGDILAGEVVPEQLNHVSAAKQFRVIREPVGPVLAISAFNHPLNLIVHQVVPAVAAGCPVIIKPSLSTPLTCLRFVELLHKSGMPKAWARVILCDNARTEALAADARFAFVNFIGAAHIGWKLRSQLAPGTRCALEHGGNAPVLMLPNSNMKAAIPSILKGGMSHAGQVCISVQRVYVPYVEAAAFTRALAGAAEHLQVGNPLNDTTDIGPLIRPQEVTRVHEWVGEALAAGAKLMRGGDKITDTCYKPTILMDPPENAKVTKDEIFGPVICVYGYEDVHEALQRVNASRYHFQAAVWGRDMAGVNEAAAAINAAAVMINDNTAFRVDWMPFGGRSHSGLGVGGIGYTMQDYTQHKMIVSPAF